MSRTIQTKSDSEFFTNINEEQLLGHICKDLGCPHHIDFFSGKPVLAYTMTKEEVNQVAEKFRQFARESVQEDFVKYKRFFSSEVNLGQFKRYLLDEANDFENSEGYECVS